jgi:hypothetical protein
MINIIRNGDFLIPPLVAIVTVIFSSLLLILMVFTSYDSSVRSADARCQVGEVISGSETIRVKLTCDEQGIQTSTLTSQPESVLTILRANSPAVMCNVMHTGWARDCRAP